MKTMGIKTLTTGVVGVMILFSGCKKTAGPDGAAGPQGPAGVVPAYSDGFIKGTFIGTERDGTTSINETFNFTTYFQGPAGTLDSAASGYTFNFSRMTDVFQSNNCQMSIFTTSLTSFSSAFTSFNFTYTKSL